MRDAGIEHVRCIEHDESAAATLKAAGFPAVVGDVRDLALYADLPPIDLMWASPPCQDWSSAGRREGSTGDRNGFPWTWDVIDHLRERGIGPTWLVAENVPGMLTHSGAHCGAGCCADPDRCARTYFLEVLLAEARKRFASVTWRVLDAATFGVAQFRRRIFLVCGPRPIRWPTPTHGEPTPQTGLFGPGLKPWVTVRDALGLPLSDIRTEATGAVATPDTEPAPTVPTVGNQYLHSTDPGVRVSGVEIHTQRNPETAKGGNLWHPDTRPVQTLSAAVPPWMRSPQGRRRLTTGECARLQDFPADYPWQGTKTSIYRQIGNAVPARVASVLASAVMEASNALQDNKD
jgi:DNA (cytosine-5)-methyltransferase 1